MSTTDTTTTHDDHEPEETEPVAPGADDQEPAAPADAEPPVGEDDEARWASREAAKYRRRLRAAETTNEALTSRVEKLEQREFTRLASDSGIANMDDLMLVTDFATLRDEDTGEFSPDLVTAHLEQLKQERPHWFARRRPTAADYDAGAGGRPPRGERRTFADVLRPK